MQGETLFKFVPIRRFTEEADKCRHFSVREPEKLIGSHGITRDLLPLT